MSAPLQLVAFANSFRCLNSPQHLPRLYIYITIELGPKGHHTPPLTVFHKVQWKLVSPSRLLYWA